MPVGQFTALAGVVPGSTYGIGKAFAFLDLDLDGVYEIVIPTTLARQDGPGLPPWDGVHALEQPVLVFHYLPGVGLSAVGMTGQNGAPLVSGWVMDQSLADFNLDGHADILWSDTGAEVTINGDYALGRMRLISPSPTGPIVTTATLSYPVYGFAAARGAPGYGFWHSSGAGDINGDGLADFIAINLQPFVGPPDSLAAFLGDGHGGFAFTPGFLPTSADFTGFVNGQNVGAPAQPMTLAVADLNGDGASELIWGVAHSMPGMVRQNRVFWNAGHGFTEAGYVALPMPDAAAFAASGHDIAGVGVDRTRIADLNGDGRPDLLFMYADYAHDSGRWGQVWLQNADHSFTELHLWQNNQLPQLIDGPRGYSLEGVDVNGDGALDIVFTHDSLDSLRDLEQAVWINMGDGTFQSMAVVAPNVVPAQQFIAWWGFQDLDHDGQAELLASQFTGFHQTTITAYALQPGTIQALAGVATPGSIFADNIIGSSAADSIGGGLGADTFQGGAGNDTLDGGLGVDTAVFAAAAASYRWLRNDDGSWSVSDLRGASPEGADLLRSVEVLKFADRSVTIALTLPLAIETAFAHIARANWGGAGNFALASTIDQGLDAGTLTQPQAVSQIVQLARATTSVATLAYEFFTGKVPSAGGIDYLVSPTGPNPNNLNSAYYQSFNIENRYINFAVNLGKAGEGAAGFASQYGALSLFDATRKAYLTIFGSTPSDTKLHALLDPSFQLGGQTLTRADYFAAYGGDGAGGIGTKAAMVGWLLSEAVKADVGTYALSNDAFLTDLADGAAFAVDLIGTYAQPGFVFVST